MDSFDDECRLDCGKCVLNVNEDHLTKIAKLAKHKPACQVPVNSFWFQWLSDGERFMLFEKKHQKTIANLNDPSDRS